MTIKNFDLQKENDTTKNVQKLIKDLHEIRDICRENKWYASACYANMSADSLFHMLHLGDKAQRPDMMVTLTDVHYSIYPDE